MDFWPEFLPSSWGREFVAGGFGGVAGIISGYPLDTLRIRQQSSISTGSAFSILRHVMAKEGLCTEARRLLGLSHFSGANPAEKAPEV
ncbi:mitochondrial arginine transporter BAC2-like isoform X2 [Prosopis cineraria]|uniref:mitochondrial arginine transporter BAC2-like isoform X2 n=1 Tax=Prosopis cineraria TaxID=364024 RepID=UPI0024106E6A|nr:mitochondrial arginine transporter BAC2-like isoform X2 [Prosopis cineraria]